jgi:ABC-type antimicrobial peptide transport system permease subunit
MRYEHLRYLVWTRAKTGIIAILAIFLGITLVCGIVYGQENITSSIDVGSSSNSNADLINNCLTFRNIMSDIGRESCDHSMLYYKGQCEYYSAMNKSGLTLNHSEFIFCSDPNIETYIEKNNLTNSPRSSSIIP